LPEASQPPPASSHIKQYILYTISFVFASTFAKFLENFKNKFQQNFTRIFVQHAHSGNPRCFSPKTDCNFLPLPHPDSSHILYPAKKFSENPQKFLWHSVLFERDMI